MKFFTAISFAALASCVAATGQFSNSTDKPFGLTTIHSGSGVQNSGLSIGTDSLIKVGISNYATAVFTRNGVISVGTGYLSVNNNGALCVSTEFPFFFMLVTSAISLLLGLKDSLRKRMGTTMIFLFAQVVKHTISQPIL